MDPDSFHIFTKVQMFDSPNNLFVPQASSLLWRTGGKPPAWFTPGGLVELSNIMKHFFSKTIFHKFNILSSSASSDNDQDSIIDIDIHFFIFFRKYQKKTPKNHYLLRKKEVLKVVI